MRRPDELGAGWGVYREFISPDKAVIAGAQVLSLIESGSKYMVRTPYSPPGQKGVKVYNLYAWHPGTFPDYPNTIQADKVAMEECQELVDVHRYAAKFVDQRIHVAQFNIYEPGDHTRPHRDRTRGEVLALGLKSMAHCVIKDPATESWHEFDINPGDAVHFVNPRAQFLRPYHQFMNQTDEMRISLVE